MLNKKNIPEIISIAYGLFYIIHVDTKADNNKREESCKNDPKCRSNRTHILA